MRIEPVRWPVFCKWYVRRNQGGAVLISAEFFRIKNDFTVMGEPGHFSLYCRYLEVN